MSKQDQDEVPRRRGRPSGKNRVPLSVEERRARNAQYERERRNDFAEAMIDLATAAGCESSISNPDLLATVLSRIQRSAKRNSSEDIEELKRINENLESQIASLTERLETEPEPYETHAAKKYKLSETSGLRTDSEPQTSNSFDSIVDRAASKKRINKLKKGKVRKTSARNRPHNAIKTNMPIPWSNEQSESASPEQQTSHTEMWTKLSSDSALTTDSEQYTSAQDQDDNVLSLNGVNTESDSSGCRTFSTFDSQTGLLADASHEQNNQMNELEPLAQRTQYDPAPDLVPEVQSPSDIYFQFDQLNVPENQLTPESENIIDLFTESEKRLVSEWINCSSDLFRTDNYENSVPVRQWSVDDYLAL